MIIITGGAGFIGSNILIDIASNCASNCDEEITICDDFCDDFSDASKWKNLRKHYASHFVRIDKLFSFIKNHKHEISLIIHMGAISATTATNVDDLLENNYGVSKKIWYLCSKYHIRLIYASSAATYGDGTQGFENIGSLSEYLITSENNKPNVPAYKTEIDQPINKLRAVFNKARLLKPLNPYGMSKHLFDLFILEQILQAKATPPQFVGIKFFNVYGPNEYHKTGQKSIIANQFQPIANDETIKLFKSANPKYADGEQYRDFVYVKDCTKFILWAMKNKHVNGIFNIGTGKANSFQHMVEVMIEHLNSKSKIEYIPMPENIARHYQYYTEANLTCLREEIGYKEPFLTPETAIADYIDNYLTKEDPYR